MTAVRYELVGVPIPGRAPRRWAFNTPGCPLRLASTPTGLGGAPRKHVRQTNARQKGATWRGTTYDINSIGLDVRVGPVKPGRTAVELHSEWRDSLGTGEQVGEFHVFGPRGERWQYVRLDEAMPDPDLTGLEWNGVTTERVKLSSDSSLWMAHPVVLPLTPAEFPGARIRNGGDVDSALAWELTGPGTFTIGTPTEHHKLPAIPAGETWTVDTDPDNPSIRDQTGRDRWDEVGIVAWYEPVPAGRTVDLTLTVTGSGSGTRAVVRLPQLHTRAT